MPIGAWFMTSWNRNVVNFVMSTGKKLQRFIKSSSTIPATENIMKEYKFLFVGVHKRNNYHDALCYLAETAEEALKKCQTIRPDFEIHNWGLLEHMV